MGTNIAARTSRTLVDVANLSTYDPIEMERKPCFLLDNRVGSDRKRWEPVAFGTD
jgi:hypothetical protein